MERRRIARIRLTRGQSQLIDQEKRRLREKYKIKISDTEFIQILMEQHRLKMKMMATDDPDSVHWFYRQMAER